LIDLYFGLLNKILLGQVEIGYLLVVLKGANAMMQIFLILVFGIFFIANVTLANMPEWSLESEYAHYQKYLKDYEGLGGTVLGNLKYYSKHKAYRSFNRKIQNLRKENFDKQFIYFELNVNEAHQIFVWIGMKNGKCKIFAPHLGKHFKNLKNYENMNVHFKQKVYDKKLLISDGTFFGLTVLEDDLINQHYGVVDTGSALGVNSYEKILPKLITIFHKNQLFYPDN
jgi:hypothetical protein